VETFILASVSLTIAVSLVIMKKKDASMRAFAMLCLALFFNRIGVFFFDILHQPFWHVPEYGGLLALPPLALHFTGTLTRGARTVRKRDILLTAVFSCVMAVLMFTPVSTWPYFRFMVHLYPLLIIGGAYLTLLLYIYRRRPSVERKRMMYLSIACIVAALLCGFDLFSYFGLSAPSLSNIIIAALIYFILLIIAYPHLTKLYELMAKSLLIFILTTFATIVFYFVLGLFGKNAYLPFTHVLTASFLIVISITPLKIIVKRIFSYFYPESTDVFQSLYAFDEKLEREKTLLLEEMAPVLAHEIRNPLGSIKGAAQFLSTDTDSEEHKKLLNVIIEEVNRLNRVVSQFLDYAKPYSIEPRPEDINRIIQKVVSIIQADGAANEITIETDLHPDLPPIEIDAERLIQVILNIAFNAVEAMAGRGTLSFRTTRIESEEEQSVGIYIRDTGPGIAKKDLKQIFKPFFTTKERGVGLGLSICQRIIRDHGGYIRVKSIPGKGTIFFIRIVAKGR
jgi:signal transduction histidine kinase